MDACFHGGSFWEELGPEFYCLARRGQIVNADVLDAWFPPAPGILASLLEAPDWVSRTSPPTHAEGLRSAVSRVRRVDECSVLVGPGSSSLIYLAFLTWLKPSSRVLLIEPSYGEYMHLAERVVGATVDRMTVNWFDGFHLDLEAWTSRLRTGNYDLAVLVNPNNPTGRLIPREELRPALAGVPPSTRVLIDEAYIDYGGDETMEGFAAASENVFVVKSMSKAYALSGLRAAYLVGPSQEIHRLAERMPPWSVSLPAQIAATAALGETGYYQARYAETAELRHLLAEGLCSIGGEVRESIANWVLWRLPEDGATATQVIEHARRASVHLRNAGQTAPSLGDRVVRIAVKDGTDTARILPAVKEGFPRPLRR